MTEVFTLFFLFIVKHFVADFPLQSYKMVQEKGTYGKLGGLYHSGIHAGMTLGILLFFVNPILALVLAIVDYIFHYHIDFFKMNISKCYTPSDQKFWVWLGIDQLLHYLTYLLIIFISV